MKFLFNWLRTRPAERLILHPTRRVPVRLSFEKTYARCIQGIEGILGGIVRDSDAAGGTIEATFGLIESERLTCTLERVDSDCTDVIIESRRGARLNDRGQSPYVNALADYLESS